MERVDYEQIVIQDLINVHTVVGESINQLSNDIMARNKNIFLLEHFFSQTDSLQS
jgi:hypothetical protein